VTHNLEGLSTEELVGQFRKTAKLTPTVWTDKGFESLKRTPERIERVALMQALGVELRRRKPVDDVRPLFLDADVDVRFWASAQLHRIDPEWANAASGSVHSNLPVPEVFDLARLARQAPPPKPTIIDMTDDQLVARFEDAATRLYAMNFHDPIGNPNDMDLMNRIYGEVWDVGDQLVSRLAAGRLLPYLDHRFLEVRREAARFCLDVDTARAQAVLTNISENHPDISQRVQASDILEDWSKRRA
jgi:hypothetical protein